MGDTAVGPGGREQLWEGLAVGAQGMLTAGPHGLRVLESGSALAFSGINAADLNLAFAWGDIEVLRTLMERTEDFLLLVSPEVDPEVAQRAATLSIERISEPLPVWEGVIQEGLLPPGTGEARRALPSDMSEVHSVLAASFGLLREQCVEVFPESLADDIDIYLSERDGSSIATLMAVRTGSLVSLWSGGSVPEVRGQGVFTDIVAYALREQRARGARTFTGITEAVGSGRVLERLGGQHCTDAFVWVRGSSVGELLQE